jgi:hypothetical protein
MRYLLEIEIATEKIKSLRQEQTACNYKGKDFEKWHSKLKKAIISLKTILGESDFELNVIEQFNK